MKTVTASGLVAALLLATLILGTPVNPSSAAKPAPRPPLPPVRYRIQYWQAPNGNRTSSVINDMNNLGQVVSWSLDANGEQFAMLYDPRIDPNEAVDLDALVRSHGGAGIPEGWKLASAVGINDQGVIVGYLSPVGAGFSPQIRQPYFLDINANDLAVVSLPSLGSEWSYAQKINENGDILGAFRDVDGIVSNFFFNPAVHHSPLVLPMSGTALNNPVGDRPAQVAGTSGGVVYRWTPETDELDTFPNLTNAQARGLNDSGTICGKTDVTVTTKTGKTTTTTTTTYPMRLKATLELLTGAPNRWGYAINSSGDVLIGPDPNNTTREGTIYRDDWQAWGKYVNINQLLVGTADDMAAWSTATHVHWWQMNDRDLVSDAGQIAGLIRFADGTSSHFVLTPIAAP